MQRTLSTPRPLRLSRLSLAVCPEARFVCITGFPSQADLCPLQARLTWLFIRLAHRNELPWHCGHHSSNSTLWRHETGCSTRGRLLHPHSVHRQLSLLHVEPDSSFGCVECEIDAAVREMLIPAGAPPQLGPGHVLPSVRGGIATVSINSSFHSTN